MNILDGRVSAVVLGIAQDAGVPHAGCRCPRCRAAYSDQNLSLFAASLAIVDVRQSPPSVWLIDATPDLKHQLNLLYEVLGSHPDRPNRIQQPEGLFLTHGHMGHTVGLVHFGPEAMAVQDMRVYASAGMISALSGNRLWSPLVESLELIKIEPYQPIHLAPGLAVKPIPVPHRDETGTDTFAYQIEGETSKLLYLPDIDSWESWPDALRILDSVDMALVDATFFSRDEIQDRKPVSHPLVTDTLARFGEVATRLILTHLNHTNPLLDVSSEERRLVESLGVEVAYRGQTFEL